MLQITIFLLTLALIYVVKCVVIARSSRELAADAAAISLVSVEGHYEEAMAAQERDKQRTRTSGKNHYTTPGLRRQVA